MRVEVDFSQPRKRMILSLAQIISWRDRPQVIPRDDGLGNISIAIPKRMQECSIRFAGGTSILPNRHLPFASAFT